MERVGIGPPGTNPRRRNPLWTICQRIVEADDHEWRRVYVSDDKRVRDHRIRQARHRYGPPAALGWQFTTQTTSDGYEIWAHYLPDFIEDGIWEAHHEKQLALNRERNRRQRARQKTNRQSLVEDS